VTEKEFEQAIKRGLGSAIVELKKCEDKMKYYNIVLSCCLHDITFERIMEGTKGSYLYSAICELGVKNNFEQILIDKFSLSHCANGLFFQLIDILYCYANDGNSLSKDALYKKYDFFASKNGKLLKNKTLDESEQWDEVAVNLFYLDGFSVFKRYVVDIGKILNKNPHNEDIFDEWVMVRAENFFGEKRIKNFFETNYEKSIYVKTLYDVLKARKLLDEQEQEKKMKKITVENFVEIAKGAASDKQPYHKMYKIIFGFLRNASDSDFLELANVILAEENETVKFLLLKPFSYNRPFPLEITPLLQYAQSNNTSLVQTAIKCLGNFKDERIHDLAIMLLKTKGLNSFALGLIKENYKKSDENIINSLIKKATSILHHVQSDIAWIYRHRRSSNILPTLLKVYKKGNCTYCRYDIIKIMYSCKVLSDEILEECLYDSNSDTRSLAKQLIAKNQRQY